MSQDTVVRSSAVFLMAPPYAIALDKVTHFEQTDMRQVRIYFTSFGFVDVVGDVEELMEQMVAAGVV